MLHLACVQANFRLGLLLDSREPLGALTLWRALGQALGQVQQVGVADVAGSDHHGRATDVVSRMKTGQFALARAVEAALGAGDGAAKRLVGPECFVGQLQHVLRRLVVGHRNFLLDDAAFAGDLASVENRVEVHVGEHIHQCRRLAGVGTCVVAGVFLAGAGVDVAADALDFAGDLRGRAALGSLEQHVLEKVADAVLRLVLATAADGCPNAEADAGHLRHFDCGEAESVWQLSDVIHP